MLASPDATRAVAVDAAGAAQLALAVPNDPGLVDVRLYGQVLVLDAPANALGAVSTNAAELEIGVP